MQVGDQRAVRDALRAIAGKPVMRVARHHDALLAWNDWAPDWAPDWPPDWPRDWAGPPRPLSIDDHTKSHPACLGSGCAAAGGVGRSAAADRCRVRRLAQLNPADPTVFDDLVRCAIGITIAQEPGCVDPCQRDAEGWTAAWLQAQRLAHLKTALDA